MPDWSEGLYWRAVAISRSTPTADPENWKVADKDNPLPGETEIFIPLSALSGLADDLDQTDCTYWACDGERKKIIPMKTCSVCGLAIELNKIINSSH